MKKYLQKIVYLAMYTMITGVVFAQGSPDRFEINMESNTFNVGEAVDFTVKAIKNDAVMKDCKSWGFMFLKGDGIANLDKDVTLPNEGWFEFDENDQGIKRYFKGLSINRAGVYTLTIEDMDSEAKGEISLIVGGPDTVNNLKKINITTPSSGTIETKKSTMVIGNSSELKNSPVIIYLNKKPVGSGYTDGKGSFSIYISGLSNGKNEIQAKIVDKDEHIIGESEIIPIVYESAITGELKSIEILPAHIVKQGTDLNFNVNTSDTVNSVKLLVGDSKSFSMDRVSPGYFSKKIETSFFGDYNISLEIVDGSNIKRYDNIDSISIAENVAVSNIKFTATGMGGTSVIVSWNTIGSVPKYGVNYGTGRDSLSNTLTVTSPEILVENLQKDSTYYFQIIPMDDTAHTSGDPSQIVEYRTAALPCVVKGITVKTEKIGDNYYLVWDSVENAVSYEVYRSDRKDMTDSRKVGELTGTRFQYLFNPDAKKDEYAYYQIHAICLDNSTVLVDDAKKVKVGPFENTLLIVVLSIFVYSMYRLHKMSEG